MLTTIFSFLPILLLVFLMTKKNSMPSSKALPLSALILYLIMMIVFKHDANLVHATVVKGWLVAWTPIFIIGGAIFLFKTMEITGSLEVIREWLNTVSENKIAQLMIVGWAFPFLIEGASGFGTPAAIAAPILVGLGFPPVRVAVLTLITNSIPVSFGAVGTPTWFGFSTLDLSHDETMIIGFKTAILNGGASLVIPALALITVVKPKSVIKNLPFILLSVLVTVVPYIIIAKYSYEFPSLVGGTVGLILTIIIAKYGIGLSKEEVIVQEPVEVNKKQRERKHYETPSLKKLIKATFPLWGLILTLVITRIPDLGIKQLLTSTENTFDFSIGSFGVFGISSSLVVTLKHIFGSNIEWMHKLLYVPSFIPFGLISIITFYMYSSKKEIPSVFVSTIKQMATPTKSLLGALIFVNLMMMGGDNSAVTIIGKSLANLTGDSWKYFASLLGAIGTFFSGSNTISNLTFGAIQDSISLKLGLDRTTILAMQSVGGAMGAMISINNIVAVSSVLALGNIEGYILKKTVRAMLVYSVIVAIMAIFI